MGNEIILDTDQLYRRLEEEDFKGDYLPENIKSSAFSDPDGEPSVHLERLADFEIIAQQYPETISYAIFVTGAIRQNGFDAEHRPCPSDHSHSVMLSSGMDLRKQTVRKKLKKLVSRLDYH